MPNFVSVQGGLKFQPNEYIEYFEDLNLSPTLKWGKRGYFSRDSRN
jgi:hypothetical protein